MKVSVIMSCFNSESTVRKSVESILNQSYKDFEFLICDDGSIDKTYITLLELSQNDKRIKIFKNDKNYIKKIICPLTNKKSIGFYVQNI